MTTPIDTQTKINDVYRTAILSAFDSNDEPLTNADLSGAVLGGVEAAEVMRYIKEPFVPVLVSMIANGTLACWATDDEGIRYDLFTRVDGEELERAEAGRVVAQEFSDSTYVTVAGYNDPANWRAPLDDTIAKIAGDMVDSLLSPPKGDETVH